MTKAVCYNIGLRLKVLPSRIDRSFPRRRLILEWFAVLVLAGLAAASAFSNAGQQVSAWIFDHELSWSAPPIDPRILIVQIDEESLGAIGKWPWPRTVHAQLIDRLTDGGTKIVAYDVLFVEPSDQSDDNALASAIARSNRVVVPAYATVPGTNGAPFDLQLPLSAIAAAAKDVGHVNVIFDPDGQVRHSRLAITNGAVRLPHLMAATMRQIEPGASFDAQEIAIAYNPAGSFSAVPADRILRGEVPANLLRDRIVLVGATAQGLGDILPVPGPAGSVTPGIEVQANILNSLLHGIRVRDVGPKPVAVLSGSLFLLLMVLFWRVRPTIGLALTFGIAAGAMILSAITLGWLRIWVTPVPLLAALLVAYPLWNWRRLSALNRFVEDQTSSLGLELGIVRESGPGGFGLDSIAVAAGTLRAVIGELSDRRRFLRDVIESAPDAMGVLDRHGIVSIANDHAKQLLGTDAEGNQVRTLLCRIAPAERIDDEELELSDGRTMLVKSAPFIASQGNPEGSILRLVDISDRRASERERDEFLEFLSHDMRAPQTGILAVLNLAKARPKAPVPLRRIRDYAQKSLKLADDFVHLARLSVMSPRIEFVDLGPIFEEAVDQAYDAARTRKVKVDVAVSDASPPIAADPWLLQRMISNLLDNAIKYSPERGTIQCRVEAQSGSEAALPGTVFCEICDKGPGISEERLAALFTRYGPNDQTHGLSAGLGLAFVKRAADLMEATIDCQSDAGGTRFRIGFPAVNDLPSVRPAQ